MTERKKTKAGKKHEQIRNDVKSIIAIFPNLQGIFEVESPEISVDDVLGCNPNAILKVYDFFLRCLSQTSFETLRNSDLQTVLNMKPDSYSRSLSDTIHKVRFFFAVKEMILLANGPQFVLKNLSHPELSKTVMFFKKIFTYLQFYGKECLKCQEEKYEENSLRGEVALLRKEVMELRERDEMLDAKFSMEEVAKGKVQEDLALLNHNIEVDFKKVQQVRGELQECEKRNLIAQDRASEAKLFLLDVQRNTKKRCDEIVTSPDRLLEQKTASEKLIGALFQDSNNLEKEIVNRKKNIEGLESNVPALENVLQSCDEVEPLVKHSESEKQKCAEHIHEKEDQQMKLESLMQEIGQLNKNLKTLKERYDRLSSESKHELMEESSSQLPNEAEFLQGEFARNLDVIEELKEDVNSLNEIMDDYRKSYDEDKSKLVASYETFSELHNTIREELQTKLFSLEEYFLKNNNA